MVTFTRINNSMNVKIFCCLLIGYANAADMTDISRLRQNLLNNYDHFARPVQNHKGPTVVEVSFYKYYGGIEVDEKRSLLTLRGLTALYWEDQHIKWEPKDYRNLSYVQFAANELWTPDLNVYNNYDNTEFNHFGNTNLLAYHDGMIYWIPPSTFQIGCAFDVTKWPYDIQNCHIQFGSWSHDGEQLQLFLHENSTKLFVEDDVKDIKESREWEMTSNSVELRTLKYSCCPEPFYDIIITIDIQRRGSTHFAVVVAVLIGITCAVLISFWLSPHANERVPLILSVLVINVLYLNYIYKIIPNNGKSVPLVVSFYRDSLILVVFNLLWTVILRYVALTKRNSPVPLPSLITSFLASWVATILCLNPRPTVEVKTELPVDSEIDEKMLMQAKNPYQEDWTWLAHLLDRIMFIIYLIVYISFLVAFL